MRGSAIIEPGESAPSRPPVAPTGWATSRWTRAAMVALAYFAGGQVDALLGWTIAPSILWPPNAILLAALLLVPTRDWWVYVLAVLPADHAIGWHLPLHVRLALFVANTAQTLIVASMIRWGGRGGPHWDDHRFVLRFCFGALAGPCVGGLLGSAAIHSVRPGVSFWLIWRGWIVANLLTLLAIVPMLTSAATWIAARLRGTSSHRLGREVEGAILFGALVFVALAVFEARWSRPEAMAAMLYAPLPLLLWATLRMGTGGAAAAQLVVVLIAIHGAAHGRGPIPATGPENVLQVQFLLIAVSLPLLVLSASLHEEFAERRALAAAYGDMRRLEQRLIHVARVAIVGEITAAVTHEVFQPLTAILANAQAAQRFLAVDSPDLAEVRGALKDIAADAKRTAEASQRLRELLKNGQVQQRPLDLNNVIREVARLVDSDAASRNVSLLLELDPRLPQVSGDYVQLQQVVLNLITNGFAAMVGTEAEYRRLVIRTTTANAGMVEASVCDGGTGIDVDQLREIFEPFFTTKTDGFGMGLSISTSIIHAHGGRITAANNIDRGATFSFTLPAVADGKGAAVEDGHALVGHIIRKVQGSLC